MLPLGSCRCVAQFGRALRSGRRGRRFKSCRIDYQRIPGKKERKSLAGAASETFREEVSEALFMCRRNIRALISASYTKSSTKSERPY